jgi:sensor histidine kinase regulating citrate/malate metabolism
MITASLLFGLVTALCFSGLIEKLQAQVFLLIMTMCVLLFLAVILIYFNRLNESNKQKHILIQNYKERNQMQNQYYEALYQRGIELDGIQHDTRHHYRYLYELLKAGNVEEGKDYLKGLQEGLNQVARHAVYSGNPVVDAVIYGVLGDAIEKDRIVFHYEGRLPNQLGIQDVDLCGVLSNGLENALEACQRLEEPCVLGMSIGCYQDKLCITIENPMEDIPSGRKERTSKEDKSRHGFGLRNMERITEKYNGNLYKEETEGKFILHIYLEQEGCNEA